MRKNEEKKKDKFNNRSVKSTLSTAWKSKQCLCMLWEVWGKRQNFQLRDNKWFMGYRVIGGPVPIASGLLFMRQGQQSLFKIVHRIDLEWRRERGRGSWHAMRKSQLSLHIFAMMAWIKLRCAKYTPAFGPTTCTTTIYSADSWRPHWSRQHCQGQFHPDELFHIILRMGNNTYPPLAPPMQGGITFLEWHLTK